MDAVSFDGRTGPTAPAAAALRAIGASIGDRPHDVRVPPAPSGPAVTPARTALVIALCTVALVAAGLVGFAARAALDPWADHWDPRVVDLVAFVERERGLVFRHAVHVDFVDRATMLERLGDATDAASGQSETEADRAPGVAAGSGGGGDDVDPGLGMLRAIGLAQGSFDTEQAATDVRELAVSAFYDPATKRIVTPDGVVDLVSRATLVHELTHALQDQYFHLEAPGNALAMRAVVEGDARRIENRYYRAASERDRSIAQARLERENEQLDGDLVDQPGYLQVYFAAPYALGEPMVGLVAAAGGNAAVDELFRRPPQAERAVFDPVSALVVLGADEQPAVVSEPFEGEPLWTEELGSLGLYLLLLASGQPVGESLDATLERQADEMQVVDREGRTCVEVEIRTASTEAAERLADALSPWAGFTLAQREVEADFELVTITACDPGAVDQSLRPLDIDVLAAPASLNYVIAELLDEGVDRGQARCAARQSVLAHIDGFSAWDVELDAERFRADLDRSIRACEGA